jgi:hypothetical protein
MEVTSEFRGVSNPWLLAVVVLASTVPAAATEPLWSHLDATSGFENQRGTTVTFDPSTPGGRLTMVARGGHIYTWAMVPAPAAEWNLAQRAAVEATFVNRSTEPVETTLWVVADAGWESIADFAVLRPGEIRTFSCPLRATFPDGTPKLDPARVRGVQVMLRKPTAGQMVEVADLAAVGEAPPWTRPAGRFDVPTVEDGPPAPGRRVRYRPLKVGPGIDTPPAALLYLPSDWQPGGSHPVVVEYPGNIFFTPACYSTGLPEQCVIGYGMTQGRGAIWISLPFVDATGHVAENGWGDPERTADFCVATVEDVCERFSGDRERLVLTGFSRGAIACGFIGLRNDHIAPLWKGLHCCQHYDGDGWNGATLDGALERAGRFRGAAVFHTDNSADAMKPITEALGVPTTFVSSGLGAHSCAMFLDDRESTKRVRMWFENLTAAKSSPSAPGAATPRPR